MPRLMPSTSTCRSCRPLPGLQHQFRVTELHSQTELHCRRSGLMKITKSVKIAALLIVLLSFFHSGKMVLAQGAETAIGGTVQDSSGAVVPNAQVTLLSAATGATRSMATGPQGTFLFTATLP